MIYQYVEFCWKDKKSLQCTGNVFYRKTFKEEILPVKSTKVVHILDY